MSKRRAQSVDSEPKHVTSAFDPSGQPEKVYGPWLCAESAADYLDFSDCKEPVEAFRAWAKRKGIAAAHRGTKLIYAKADLLRAVGASSRKSA